jgi:hypothetical protein
MVQGHVLKVNKIIHPGSGKNFSRIWEVKKHRMPDPKSGSATLLKTMKTFGKQMLP